MTAKKVSAGIVTRAAAAWVGWVALRPKFVFGAALLSFVLALVYAALTLSINTDDKDMLSAELPFRQNDRALEGAFPVLDEGLIAVLEGSDAQRLQQAARLLTHRLEKQNEIFHDVFYPPAMPFMRRNGLLYLPPDELSDLAGRLADASPLLSLLSEDQSFGGLARLFERLSDHQDRLFDREGPLNLLQAMSDTAQSFQQGKKAPLSWRSLLMADGGGENVLASELVILRPKLDFSGLAPAAKAEQAVRDAFAALPEELRYDLRLSLTGDELMFQEELASLEEGMGLIGLAALLAVGGILWLGLGSWRVALALVLTLLVGLSWTAAFAALTVGTLNLISVAFAVLFIGLGVDFAIHFLARAMNGSDGDAAGRLRAAAGHCGGVLGLCALSSAIAFYSFLPTDYRGISELGVISGSSMFIALAAAFTVLPAAVMLFDRDFKGSARAGVLAKAILRGEMAVARRPRLVLLLALLVGVAALFQLPNLRFDDDPLNLRDPDSRAVAVFREQSEKGTFEPYVGQLLLPNLLKAEQAAGALEPLAQVRETRSLLNLVPAEQEEKLELLEGLSLSLSPLLFGHETPPEDPATRRRNLAHLLAQLERPDYPFAGESAKLIAILKDAYETEDDAALRELEALLLGDFAGLLEDLELAFTAREITLQSLPEDLKRQWITEDGRARLEVLPTHSLLDGKARADFVQVLQETVPSISGTPVVITEAGRAVVTAFLEALGYALLAIFILLWLRLRSFLDVILVLAPLGLAGLVTMALASLIGWDFNFANVIVLPLLFGLGVDSGIHMVTRARGLGGDPSEGRTLKAILLSALTTLASFGALSFSVHPGTASMGKLLTLAIFLGLIATLVVLPAALSLLQKRREARGL